MDPNEELFRNPKFLGRLLEFLSPQTEYFKTEIKNLKKRVQILEDFRKQDIIEDG